MHKLFIHVVKEDDGESMFLVIEALKNMNILKSK